MKVEVYCSFVLGSSYVYSEVYSNHLDGYYVRVISTAQLNIILNCLDFVHASRRLWVIVNRSRVIGKKS